MSRIIGYSDSANHLLKSRTKGYSDGTNHPVKERWVGGADGANHKVWSSGHKWTYTVSATPSLSTSYWHYVRAGATVSLEAETSGTNGTSDEMAIIVYKFTEPLLLKAGSTFHWEISYFQSQNSDAAYKFIGVSTLDNPSYYHFDWNGSAGMTRDVTVAADVYIDHVTIEAGNDYYGVRAVTANMIFSPLGEASFTLNASGSST